MEFDKVFQHPVLWYQFVTLREHDDGGGHDETHEEGQRLRAPYYSQRCVERQDRPDKLTIMELAKLPADVRPSQYEQPLSHITDASNMSGMFDELITWTYFGDDVIAFLAEAWKDQVEHDEKERAERAKRKPQRVVKTRFDDWTRFAAGVEGEG